ncbi:MAG TPA: bifunctional alpha/beta hydrolase/class I SAM-dependent methyltransferase [Candidatus Acidoferrales bacterium]|jgi:alpha-beta hydrolase superfamily lysophospholipase|nr:bifunctional alpha/beta hydrolase/class I SAM-dependent methyltransferase [Candidatus Acidoferrales bacterium]
MQTQTQTFKSWDGAELFYRAWLPAKPAAKALLLFHRGHEHSARWQETVVALGLEEIAVFAWDARGHGHSPGERGSAENLGVVIRDVEAFVQHVSKQHQIPVANMVVMAHSVGAVTAAAWVHDYAPPIRGLILAVPAFRVKLYVPFAVPLLRLKQKLFGHGYVKSYVKAKMLTHDMEQAAGYQADGMIFRQIAINILLDLYDTSTRLMADAGAITVPTLMLTAGKDWVVKPSAQQTFFDRLSSPLKRMEVMPDFYHAIFHEKNRQLVVAKAREFILECFAAPPQRVSLLDADKHGFTKDEFDRLGEPGNPMFALTRGAMKTGGRLSKGIRLGWEAGFDSGRTLDYIYENRPQGVTPLGRAIDRGYLESIGWRGIRVRKANLQSILRATIEGTHAGGKPVRLLDIASGPGRYNLEVMRDLKHIPIAALLRDYKTENVEAARRLAEELGLKNVTAEKGDAFDRASLAAITPKPTVAVVSGLYELFPSNEPVRNSLQGLADAMEPGGHLIYTNQPWHPQVEFIARVLDNREGKPWIMRRRTQAEMDELVGAAGFEKLRQETDQWGIFSVSLARRKQS